MLADGKSFVLNLYYPFKHWNSTIHLNIGIVLGMCS
jgi:hypothetical protein